MSGTQVELAYGLPSLSEKQIEFIYSCRRGPPTGAPVFISDSVLTKTTQPPLGLLRTTLYSSHSTYLTNQSFEDIPRSSQHYGDLTFLCLAMWYRMVLRSPLVMSQVCFLYCYLPAIESGKGASISRNCQPSRQNLIFFNWEYTKVKRCDFCGTTTRSSDWEKDRVGFSESEWLYLPT